jgi:hypothetical protein
MFIYPYYKSGYCSVLYLQKCLKLASLTQFLCLDNPTCNFCFKQTNKCYNSFKVWIKKKRHRTPVALFIKLILYKLCLIAVVLRIYRA